ncbi:MAG: DUF3488 domain-containing protein [Acidobacteria bacterium]|nr:DUF3488 domain-containing protein [Acidobacteriota bacterium]
MNPSPRWNTIEPFFEFSLLGLLTSGYLAVAGSGYLDSPTAAVTALGLLARALLVTGWVTIDLAPRVVNALTIAYVGFYPLDYAYISRDFLTATVHLVFFLAVVKILTAKTDRDYLYVKIIAFLELLAASILSTSANYFACLALFFFFGVATFAATEIRRSASKAENIVRGGQRRFHLRLTGLTVFTVLGILALTSALFFLLPRTARAAFQRFVPQRYHLPGFSNEVTLGQIGELKMRNTAVMHARLSQQTPAVNLKWRGAALTQFDGRRWFNISNTAEALRVEGGVLSLASIEEQLRPGPRIAYEVAMQETTSDALFFAGSPETIRILVPLVIRTPSGSFRLGFGLPDRLRYGAYALLETDGDPRYNGKPLAPDVREAHLRLPPLDSRIGQLARELAARPRSDVERARALETHLRNSYGYTTALPQSESVDPIADFLFQRKQGHCEYFASAMAVMLRSVGIPSRVVTGFQSGVFNPLSGWYLIRASDAHSWVEVFLEGKGWTTFDPTPPDPSPAPASLSMKLQLYMDALQVLWQDWVLSYDLERQLFLVTRMEQSSRGFSLRWLDRSLDRLQARLRAPLDAARDQGWKLVAAIAALLLSVILGPACWKHWRALVRFRRVRRGEASASDATLLYQRMLSVLRRRGIEKPLWLTPCEFARMVPDAHFPGLVGEFTAAYNELRFGQRQPAAPRLAALLEQLEQAPEGKRG